MPLGIIAFLNTIVLYWLERDVEKARLLQLSNSIMASVESSMNTTMAVAKVLSMSDALEARDFVEFRKRAVRALVSTPGASVILTDRSGAQIVNTAVPAGEPLPKLLPGTAAMADYQRLLAMNQPQVSGFSAVEVPNTTSVSVNVPVGRGKSAEFNLRIPVTTAYLNTLTRLKDVPSDWTIALFDESSREIARSRDSEKFVGRKAPPLLATALAEKTDAVLTSYTFDGERVFTVVSYSPRLDWGIAIGLPDQPLLSPITIALAVLIGVIIICLFGGIVAASRLAAGINRANEHRELLINELNHRVKNTLANVQSLAAQTLRRAASTSQAQAALEGRIMALSSAHNVLTQENWEGADLRAILLDGLQPFVVDWDRVRLDGPDVRLNPRISLTLALIVHELATNAVKYGALSTAEGKIDVLWSMSKAGVLNLEWGERDGPLVETGKTAGFGSVFIHGVVAELKGTVQSEFEPRGARWSIDIPIRIDAPDAVTQPSVGLVEQ